MIPDGVEIRSVKKKGVTWWQIVYRGHEELTDIEPTPGYLLVVTKAVDEWLRQRAAFAISDMRRKHRINKASHRIEPRFVEPQDVPDNCEQVTV